MFRCHSPAIPGRTDETPTSTAESRHIDFATQIAPIFTENCVKCHGPEQQKGGLRLDEKVAALSAVDDGKPAITPGNVDTSGLIYRITSHDLDEQMPPKGDRLPQAKVTLLDNWIREGAPWPDAGSRRSTPGHSSSPVSSTSARHWAFQPLSHAAVPEVGRTDWPATPIDKFILAAQEERGLRPNAEASRRVLIRRLYFDLIGLPPPPAEIAAFEEDLSPHAYEQLVDRLLASPQYGERWSRHWLDVARYADSAGFEEDRPRPYAYPYRDFIIRALNADLPYDRFIQWQIAGDILDPKNPEALAATGFIAAAPDIGENAGKKDRYDELDDIVSTTGSAVLGLTIGCARCHDHKFDPIPAADYYRMAAFFAASQRVELARNAGEGKDYDRATEDFENRLKKFSKGEKEWKEARREEIRLAKIAALPATEEEKRILRAKRNENNHEQNQLLTRFGAELYLTNNSVRKLLNKEDREHWEALDKTEEEIEATRPKPIARVLAIHEGTPKKTFILLRGDPNQEGAEVTPGTLSLFPSAKTAPSFFARLFGRTPNRAELARWLTDESHGAGALTARVAVNRLWQHHFGRGLVGTPGDFGTRGDSPTHPELLDWLAGELIRGGWRLKPLQKMIVMSAVYRQDITSDEERKAIDPANRLWWRREPQRVEAEALRDSILSVSGCLNPAQFGPAIKPRINPEAISITNREKHYDEWPADVTDGPATWRRSLYIFEKRSNLFPILQAFDAPAAIGSCTRRITTTVAPQALALMNDPFVCEQARAFATRLATAGDREAQVQMAFQLALGRKPRHREVGWALDFIGHQTAEYRAGEAASEAETDAMADFCQGLFALNEFCEID